MRTIFAYLLVSKGPAQDLGEDGGLSKDLQCLVHAVYQTVEKLKGVVLLPEVHRLAPQSEGMTKGDNNATSTLYNMKAGQREKTMHSATGPPHSLKPGRMGDNNATSSLQNKGR